MSEIDVMYTRTYDGDYLADFDCNDDDLPKSKVFFYKAIQADELAALRSRIAELEAQRDDLGPMFVRDLCEVLGSSDTSTLDCIMKTVRGLKAQSATLTPRRCSRECYLRGWQAAQEAAAQIAHDAMSVVPLGTDRRYKVAGQIESAIRALQPPADCGCNPLEPDVDRDVCSEKCHWFVNGPSGNRCAVCNAPRY